VQVEVFVAVVFVVVDGRHKNSLSKPIRKQFLLRAFAAGGQRGHLHN